MPSQPQSRHESHSIMKAKDRVRLRFGPYRTPRFRYGDIVFCERCGEVTMCGLTAARIPWRHADAEKDEPLSSAPI
jgi:hypothetical protein